MHLQRSGDVDVIGQRLDRDGIRQHGAHHGVARAAKRNRGLRNMQITPTVRAVLAAAPGLTLKEILAHNRDEEKEHAAMTLEWIRRHDAKFNEALRTYLFAEGSIVGREAAVEAGGSGAPSAGGEGSLGIGSLKR